MIRIVVNGAGGKMGREVVKAVAADPELELAGAADPSHKGEDAGILAGTERNGVTVGGSLQTVLEETHPQVVVDFTSPSVIFDNAAAVMEKGLSMVIGTTGLTEKQRTLLQEISSRTGANALIAPNFSLGAVLMMEAAEKISAYLPNAEIIELHHNHKYDAPSGTSRLTAEKMGAARKQEPCEDRTAESIPGARGAVVEGIRIHSVRLPGYVAHQEVLFGGEGEILTIRHDSLDRKSFMPGVVLACKKVLTVPGVTYGLENYL